MEKVDLVVKLDLLDLQDLVERLEQEVPQEHLELVVKGEKLGLLVLLEPLEELDLLDLAEREVLVERLDLLDPVVNLELLADKVDLFHSIRYIYDVVAFS